jgi:hypothetical protein
LTWLYKVLQWQSLQISVPDFFTTNKMEMTLRQRSIAQQLTATQRTQNRIGNAERGNSQFSESSRAFDDPACFLGRRRVRQVAPALTFTLPSQQSGKIRKMELTDQDLAAA